MNQVILIGRLARDPELRFTAGSGKAVATFTIAVDRGFGKDKEADFFRIVVWDKLGENCANYLAKGSLVAVQGRLQTNNYETQSGEKRYSVEVVANVVQFLDKRNKNDEGAANRASSYADPEGFRAIDEDDPDIPF
ncbi:MAG: single-stranded DNA-binding protein [Alkaliphilus sp.]|nr:single-stranded DNA-binding protein [Alkaliphilus sp.]